MKIYFLIFFIFFCQSCSLLSKITGERPKQKVFRVLWNKNNDPDYFTGNLPIALNSPFISQGILYVGDNNGFMKAYNLENGRLLWQQEDRGLYHSSPIIHNDHLIYGTTAGRVYSRHYLTGKLKFNVDLGAAIESKGVVYKGRLFFHLRNHRIFCLDVESGKIIWAYKRSVPYLTTVQRASVPFAIDGKIFVGFADGYILAFSVEDGVLLWESRLSIGSKFVDVDSSPLYLNEKLYISSLSGPFMMLDPKTGNVLRQADITAARRPLLLNNKLVVGTINGELVLLDDQLKIIIRKQISEGVISSVVKWKGQLVVTTVNGEMFFADAKSLNIIETFHFGHASSAVFGQAIVYKGKMAILSSRNRLYVFH